VTGVNDRHALVEALVVRLQRAYQGKGEIYQEECGVGCMWVRMMGVAGRELIAIVEYVEDAERELDEEG
jgi:hypothetical protein